MKNCIYFRKSTLFLGLLLPFFSFTQDLRTHADELFKESRYYDAFFLYRELDGTVVSQNEAAQRCSHAMALTKQFKDYKEMGKINEAKLKLEDLVMLNPYDFHKPELVKMTLDEASHLQKMASRQETAQETDMMLDKAIGLYQETQHLGWQSEEVDAAIKQCQASKVDSENYAKSIQKARQEDIQALKIRTPQSVRKAPTVVILPKEY